MLKLAVEAQLPVVEVTTRDTLNFPDVVKFITGRQLQAWEKGPATIAMGGLYFIVAEKTTPPPTNALYQKLVAAEATLLIVNPIQRSDLAFKAGEVPVPKPMLLEFIHLVVEDEEKAKALLTALGGCTIKEATECIRLTMARDKSLTPEGLTGVRKECFQGSRGITQVDTQQYFYDAPDFLEEWLKREREFFLNGHEPRLMPRGLLMDGHPGVGKTAAAKWLARQFGVPLYRMDLGGVKEKYVGSSEANMLSAMSQLDNEEPCVALFDEIEKIFGSSEHFGDTTPSMLAQLLWWLAERRTRVFVVMTTNDRKKLPPELFRDGRIDEVMWFRGMEFEAAFKFACHVRGSFSDGPKVIADKTLQGRVKSLFANKSLGTNPATVAHAAVEKAVFDLMKEAPAK